MHIIIIKQLFTLLCMLIFESLFLTNYVCCITNNISIYLLTTCILLNPVVEIIMNIYILKKCNYKSTSILNITTRICSMIQSYGAKINCHLTLSVKTHLPKVAKSLCFIEKNINNLICHTSTHNQPNIKTANNIRISIFILTSNFKSTCNNTYYISY
ncbi:LOW QUALITY PROTEIN: hypothetical protein V1477_016738 [Vespula maculifrons]|uniref:Uncharacterized protein n=1 Tax=Vespula maculifrons TaxID=7453 RepID=A0ABD2B411_VESMC